MLSNCSVGNGCMRPCYPAPPESGMPDEISKPQYWDAVYNGPEEPRWVLGQAAPPLAHWLDNARVRPGRVAVLGCGYGHDALAFAEHGFDAVGYDFAERAIERANAKVLPLH